MMSTTNDAAFDWYLAFHHPASELRASQCLEVISPSQLEYSDRGEKRRKRQIGKRGEMRNEDPRGGKGKMDDWSGSSKYLHKKHVCNAPYRASEILNDLKLCLHSKYPP